MNLSTAQDVSLYDCALSAIAPPHPLQVSPQTFRGMVGALFDLLVEQKIPATLWIKLPERWKWQVELQRYREWVNGSYPLYVIKGPSEVENRDAQWLDCSASGRSSPAKEDFSHRRVSYFQYDRRIARRGSFSLHIQRPLLCATDRQSGCSACSLDDNALIGDEGTISIPEKTHSPICKIELAPTSKLQNEYFMLVLSPRFSAAIVAHQPLDRQPIAEETHKKTDDPSLLTLYSLEPQTIRSILNGLKRSVSQGVCLGFPFEDESEADRQKGMAVCENLMGNWDSRFGNLELPPPDPILVGYLLSKQVTRIEQYWQQERDRTELAVLQQQNKELIDALKFKDEFLNKIGQELRTPLTNMKTALSLLDSPKLKPTQRERYSALLHQSCDRQSSLIDGFLELVRLESEVNRAQMQSIRLGDLVPGIVSTYQPIAEEKGILLAYTLRSTLPPVACTTEWLKKIVINLLHNAIKFTPSGGEVWVRAKQQGDYVQLEFRDTGIGVPSPEITKIFEAFYRGRQTINEDVQGAGLGLTVVQQLLLHCGGSIAVKSRVGRGSVFSVLLPIYQETESFWSDADLV